MRGTSTAVYNLSTSRSSMILDLKHFRSISKKWKKVLCVCIQIVHTTVIPPLSCAMEHSHWNANWFYRSVHRLTPLHNPATDAHTDTNGSTCNRGNFEQDYVHVNPDGSENAEEASAYVISVRRLIINAVGRLYKVTSMFNTIKTDSRHNNRNTTSSTVLFLLSWMGHVTWLPNMTYEKRVVVFEQLRLLGPHYNAKMAFSKSSVFAWQKTPSRCERNAKM